jgi:bifunctional non-homologous end joining protein LigD
MPPTAKQLEEYRRKRRFESTPEPQPKVPAKQSGAQLRFVVQKHRATQLHYDFRLELNGVLKSWAVPKGPSLDPADKRLAMMVEDHPLDYASFEGTIPEGNYGAGAVMVWDEGTWEPVSNGAVPPTLPEQEKLANALLAKGDLKFRLHGQKLKGEFVLAHMRSRRPGTKGNEWLLIKHRDDAVAPGYDIDDYDQSVTTGRTLAQIAGDEGSAKWESSRPASRRRTARDILASRSSRRPTVRVAKQTFPSLDLASTKGAVKAALPTQIDPMLATLVQLDDTTREAPVLENPGYLYEVKWDGYRAVCFVEGGRVRLYSRNQNDMTADFPELQELAKAIEPHSGIIDGEVVAIDERGRSSFSLMQQRTGIAEDGRRRAGRKDLPIRFYAFDIIHLDGYSLMKVNLEDRKQLLKQVLTPGEVCRYSDHFEDGRALLKAAREQELEGVIAKRRNSCYEQRRSREWLKLKITQTQECVIGGYTDPRGSREHFGSIVLGLYDEAGKLIHVGQAGSGFTQRTHAAMWQLLKARATERSPFANKVASTRKVYWVKPELVAQIKFTEWTHETGEGGVKMRAPVFLGLRKDKDPEDCRFEKPTDARKVA